MSRRKVSWNSRRTKRLKFSDYIQNYEEIEKRFIVNYNYEHVVNLGYDISVNQLTSDPHKCMKWTRIISLDGQHLMIVLSRESSFGRRMCYKAFLVFLVDISLLIDYDTNSRSGIFQSSIRNMFLV